MAARPERFFRLGREPEPAEQLELRCEEALRRGFPHGVSVLSETTREDASVASRRALELYFEVVKTGRWRIHYTVVLPHPVRHLDAERFNAAFGRI
jgi:hypothetical protein